MKDVRINRQVLVIAIIAAVAGYLAVWGPWVLAGAHKNMVDGMQPISLLYLTLLGFGCGLAVPHRFWVAGLASMSLFPGMAIVGAVRDPASHNLLGIEFVMYAFLTLPALFGGALGRTISGPGAQPVEFKRTGEAKVELIPGSPAVSKELEGDWEGSLKTPNGSARLVFHFKNQPDQTVAATVDDDNRMGMPIRDVKQTGLQVGFAVDAEHCTFQGSLNKEGTELAGQLTVGPTPTLLTLRKKTGAPPASVS